MHLSEHPKGLHLVAAHWAEEFMRVRRVPRQGLCAVQRFAHTTGLLTNLALQEATYDYKARYCYANAYDAMVALILWDGTGDPPGAWIKEKMSERYGPGAKTRA